MRPIRIFLAAALGMAASLAATAQTIQINGAGATFPYPIYSKWFSEYNKLHPNVEINYQSIGSGGGIRQVTEPDGVLRRHRRPDDRRAAAGGAGRRSCTSRPCSAPSCPSTTFPGVDARAEVHRRRPRRHLPRQDHEVERPGDREAEPGREAARRPTSRSCTAPTARARPTSWWTTSRRSRPSGRARSASRRRSTGRSASAARATRASPGLVKQTPGSIGYVELIYALQNKIAYGSVQNAAGEFVTRLARVGDGGGRRRGARRCRRTSASRSRTRRARAPIRSRRSPGCSSTRTRRTRRRRRSMVDFVKWALTDGQKYCAELGYAPLPGERRQAGDGRRSEDQVI